MPFFVGSRTAAWSLTVYAPEYVQSLERVYVPDGDESHKHLVESVGEISSTPFTNETNESIKERTNSNGAGGRKARRCEDVRTWNFILYKIVEVRNCVSGGRFVFGFGGLCFCVMSYVFYVLYACVSRVFLFR